MSSTFEVIAECPASSFSEVQADSLSASTLLQLMVNMQETIDSLKTTIVSQQKTIESQQETIRSLSSASVQSTIFTQEAGLFY